VTASTSDPTGSRHGHDVPVPETRWICLAVSAILVAAVLVLWIAPGRTDELFAWPIKPEMTPLFMGSAYGAGAFFFARGFVSTRWHHISAGFPGIAVFAALMFLATLIHWDKFNHGDAPFVAAASFYAWTIVYAISPLLVAWAWVRNRHTDAGAPDALDAIVPRGLRVVVGVGGAAGAAFGALLFLVPDLGVDHWPWELTPLTARVMGSFLVEGGLIALFLARDERWSAWRTLTQTTVVGASLLLVSTARAWSDWDDRAFSRLILLAVAATLASAVVLHVVMDRRARRAPVDATESPAST
jgi:multisubunit Na+/H+ antiporter MnhG subunit